MNPVTLAVGNTVKRVVIIAAAHGSVYRRGTADGLAVAMVGTFGKYRGRAAHRFSSAPGSPFGTGLLRPPSLTCTTTKSHPQKDRPCPATPAATLEIRIAESW